MRRECSLGYLVTIRINSKGAGINMKYTSRLCQRFLYGLVLFFLWYLIIYGIDPFNVCSLPQRVIYLILAIGIVIGLLPGMYLRSAIRQISDIAFPPLVIIFSVSMPFLLTIVAIRLSIGSFRIHEYEKDLISLSSVIFDVGIGIIQAVSLGVNIATLIGISRARKQISS